MDARLAIASTWAAVSETALRNSRAAHRLSLRVEQQLSALPRSRSHGYLSLADLTESANRDEPATVTGWVREAVDGCAKGPKGWFDPLRGAG